MRALFLVLPLFFSLTAQADWTSLRCQSNDEPGFLLIAKDPAGTFHVETAQTRRYLIGLQCKVPQPGERTFYCNGSGGANLAFFSAWIKERGFTKDSYGEFVDRERLEIVLRYSYTDSKGNGQSLERIWKFTQDQCVGSEQ